MCRPGATPRKNQLLFGWDAVLLWLLAASSRNGSSSGGGISIAVSPSAMVALGVDVDLVAGECGDVLNLLGEDHDQDRCGAVAGGQFRAGGDLGD
jgi:hypothetical protein